MNGTGYPGAYGENWLLANQNALSTPGPTQQYWQGVQGKYNPGSTPSVTNRAGEAYQRFAQRQPANLEPYYDRARQKTRQNIDTSAAARGMFGSTPTMNTTGEAMADLSAQQAMDEARYGLQYGQTMGQLGRGADISSMGRSQNELGWLQGLGGLSQAAGQERMGQLGQAGAFAFQGQDAYERALQADFARNMAMQNAMAGYAYPTYMGMLGQDYGLMGNAIAQEQGLGEAAIIAGQNRKNEQWNDIGNAAEMMKMIRSGGMGGGNISPMQYG